MNLWGLIKGLLVQDETDRTKELSLEIDPAATTGTRMTVKSAQTADRTLNLPDADDTLVGKETSDELENKTMDFSTTGTNILTADSLDLKYDNASSGLAAINAQDAIDEVEARVDVVETGLADHLVDAGDAHDASAISNVPAGNLAATDVQGALNELQSDIDTRATQAALDAHLNDVSDAHDASAISNAPLGNLVATNVQDALDELQTDIDATASALTVHESDTSTHGISSEIVGTTETQVLTNKTLTAPAINNANYNGGTATNISRLLLPSETTANLDVLTDVSGLFAYDTTLNLPVYNNGSGWQQVGNTGANTTLSNLTSPVALNQHLLPSSPNSRTLGDATNYMQGVFSLGVNVSTITFREGTFATTKGAIGAFGGVPTPGGGTAEVSFRNTFNAPTKDDVAVFSDSRNLGDAVSTGDLLFETGNNSAGTGNSGLIRLRTGSSFGGLRGRIEMEALVIDHNQTTSEAVVWENGATGARPGSPVLGQRFFDTTLGIPIWYNGTNWVDATGATV